MKIKFVPLFIFLLLTCSTPVIAEYANNNGADYASLYNLNKLVRVNDLKSKLIFATYDNKKIDEIMSNKALLNEPEIKSFCLNCMCRNERILRDFNEKYFLPSYQTYKTFDDYNDITLNEWIKTIGLGEQSTIKEYYYLIEQNYKNCKDLYIISKQE